MAVLAICLAAPAASAADRFKTESGRARGASSLIAVSPDVCEYYADRVWVTIDSEPACIAFYATPNAKGARKAVVFFDGDVPSTLTKVQLDAYDQRRRANLQALAKHFGVPFIQIARPGTDGSTGDHRARREHREYVVLNAALDRLRENLKIGSFVLAGQSGGATVVGALLVLGRQDVVCATPGSGGYDVRGLYRERSKASGVELSVEELDRLTIPLFSVIDQVERVAAKPERRIFIVADQKDAVTPFVFQRAFADRLRAAGHHAVLVPANGTGEGRHGLAGTSLLLAGLCAQGRSDEEIASAANRSLTKSK